MTDPTPHPTGTLPAPAGTPNALRSRMLIRTMIGLVIVVLVIGASLLYMETRKERAASERKERSQAHVILRPTDEAQDWRVKEGARVEELHQTIERLEREVKQYREQQERDGKRNETAGPRQRVRPGGGLTPPLPPLAEILPNGQDTPEPGRAAPGFRGPRPRAPVTVHPTSTPAPDQPGGAETTRTTAPQTRAPGASTPAQPPPIPGFRPPDTRTTPPVPPQDTGKLHVITPRVLPNAKAPDSDLGKVGWLPSGSFIKARLLSGVDAGTGTGMNLPYPVLMKLTDPAVLPNRYQMDLADCLVIGAAVGDLPSERVFIRTETLSCLRRNGGLITIDGELKGHVVGEDGKLGLRGRVVEKTGKIIVRSMIAGFLAGLSDAFKPRITYAPIAVGGTTDQSFQLPPMADTLQAAGITGTGKTMELLAKHYLDQMGKLYPIIEIESLRTVDIVILKGLPLKFRAQQRPPGEPAEATVIE
jgi:hypothetical protein